MRELLDFEKHMVAGGEIVPEGCGDELIAYIGASAALVASAPSIGGLLFTGSMWAVSAYSLDTCTAPSHTMVDEFGCHHVSS